MTDVIDPTYLPFTAEELHQHFLVDAARQVAYFEKSARRYRDFLAAHPNRKSISIADAKLPCQIEKDERFWTATAMKQLVARPDAFGTVLARAFGDHPPLVAFENWTQCLSGRLHLILEATLPSPSSYVRWLRVNLASRHLVPYVMHAAQSSNERTLEGATHVDAVIVNADNGFSLLVEAKVLSDVSYVVSFDPFRNQIARNIDVMLEATRGMGRILESREPERSLFALLTPACFREHPQSRLFGWLFREYTTSPAAIGRDLAHRSGEDWSDAARRLGWITFEDVACAIPGACPWLEGTPT